MGFGLGGHGFGLGGHGGWLGFGMGCHGLPLTDVLARSCVEQITSHIEDRRRARRIEERLPEEHAYLTKDEVVAVRLYSGPAYQLINGFLRQVSLLDEMHRRMFATNPEVTFAATVGHICSAIRKLSAVATPSEAQRPLYRAVRGVLPKSFWVRDEQGMIVATELGFMSTSSAESVPLGYMRAEEVLSEADEDDDPPNVLWKINARSESTEGFHHGADISLLSQYAEEGEVIFPPCTMLTVVPPDDPSGFRMLPSRPTDVDADADDVWDVDTAAPPPALLPPLEDDDATADDEGRPYEAPLVPSRETSLKKRFSRGKSAFGSRSVYRGHARRQKLENAEGKQVEKRFLEISVEASFV